MSNQSVSEYLSTHDFFSGLNQESLAFLSQKASTIDIEKGQVLFQMGDHADKFYIVLSGRISIQIPAIMGPTLEIQSLSKEQILGWSWLIPPYQWLFQAMAKEDTTLLEFNGSEILAKCEQDPEFGYQLLKRFAALMSERLDASRQKMMDEWNPSGFA